MKITFLLHLQNLTTGNFKPRNLLEESHLAAPPFPWIFMPTILVHLLNASYHTWIILPAVFASVKELFNLMTIVFYVTFSGLGATEVGILAADLVKTLEECEHMGDTATGFEHIKAGCFLPPN